MEMLTTVVPVWPTATVAAQAVKRIGARDSWDSDTLEYSAKRLATWTVAISVFVMLGGQRSFSGVDPWGRN